MAEKQSTSDYWEARYAAGGNSGKGSGGVFAEFKAEIVNTFVREHDIAYSTPAALSPILSPRL